MAITEAITGADGTPRGIPGTAAAVATGVPRTAATAMSGAVQTAGVALGTAQERAHAAAMPTRVALMRGRGGLIVAIAAFLGFLGVFALVRAKRSAAADVAVTMKLQSAHNPALAKTMEVASWPGFPPQSRVIPPLVVSSMWLLRFRVEAVFQLIAWCTGFL